MIVKQLGHRAKWPAALWPLSPCRYCRCPACQSNEQTGGLVGAGGGAVLGGLIGQAAGHSTTSTSSAPVLALWGGIVGTAIGRQLDRADQKRAAEATHQALAQPVYYPAGQPATCRNNRRNGLRTTAGIPEPPRSSPRRKQPTVVNAERCARWPTSKVRRCRRTPALLSGSRRRSGRPSVIRQLCRLLTAGGVVLLIADRRSPGHERRIARRWPSGGAGTIVPIDPLPLVKKGDKLVPDLDKMWGSPEMHFTLFKQPSKRNALLPGVGLTSANPRDFWRR